MMVKGNIAAVCYLNTIPFVYGIDRASADLHAGLLLDVPAYCTKNFIEHRADIALIPAADLKRLKSYEIITDFCIGADDFVRTVVLLSNYPIDQIETIYLDSHSHTSVELIKILAREHWEVNPQFSQLDEYVDLDLCDQKMDKRCGYLLIGDKVFDYENKFSHCYDLAHEWKMLTSLPFVFAVWVARENSCDMTTNVLNRALSNGVNNIEKAVDHIKLPLDREIAIDYLKNNISFDFDAKKRAALNLFLQKIPPSPIYI